MILNTKMAMKCLTFFEVYRYPVSSLYFKGSKLSCCCFHFHAFHFLDNSVAPHSACKLLTNTPHLVKKKTTTTTTTYAYKFSRFFIEKTKSSSNNRETRLQSFRKINRSKINKINKIKVILTTSSMSLSQKLWSRVYKIFFINKLLDCNVATCG